MQQENVRKSSPALVLLAWLVVVLPLGWGLTYTVANAMKIFSSAPAPAAAPASSASPAATH